MSVSAARGRAVSQLAAAAAKSASSSAASRVSLRSSAAARCGAGVATGRCGAAPVLAAGAGAAAAAAVAASTTTAAALAWRQTALRLCASASSGAVAKEPAADASTSIPGLPGGVAEQEALLDLAVASKSHAYAPYSEFRVGAAVRTSTPATGGAGAPYYTGCNVENASYGLTICAERTALTKAVSEGALAKGKDGAVTHVVVATDVADRWLPPCGACRQFIMEFGPDVVVVMVRPDRTFKCMTAAELLPGAFVPEDLELERIRDE